MLLTTSGQQLDNIDVLTYTSYVGAPLPFFNAHLLLFPLFACVHLLASIVLPDTIGVSYDMVMGTCTVLEIAKYIGLSEGTVSIELRYSE